MNWQPIETAPMDGHHVLLYTPRKQFVGFKPVGTYAAEVWCYAAPGCPFAPEQPTHWMPLPPPPEAA